MQYNGRLCYTDNNGCGLHTDTLMSVGNVGNVSFPVEEDTLQRQKEMEGFFLCVNVKFAKMI